MSFASIDVGAVSEDADVVLDEAIAEAAALLADEYVGNRNPSLLSFGFAHSRKSISASVLVLAVASPSLSAIGIDSVGDGSVLAGLPNKPPENRPPCLWVAFVPWLNGIGRSTMFVNFQSLCRVTDTMSEVYLTRYLANGSVRKTSVRGQ